MTRLHAEITRSISFYRSQQGGSQPVRVYLAGGAATMPYMREFFHEKFQMPVEFFNPLRNVTVAPHLNVDELSHRAHTLGGLVGLALRGSSSCPMELNLRPASVIRHGKAAEQRPAYIMAGISILAGLAAWWLYFDHATQVTAEVNDHLTPKISDLKNYEGKINAVEKEIEAQKEAAQPVLLTVTERDYWAKIFNDVNSRVPKDFVWITSLTPELRQPTAPAQAGPGPRNQQNRPGGPGGPGGLRPEVVLQVTGFYLDNERETGVVDDFVDKLAQSELYTVDKSKFVRSQPNDQQWAYEYSFPLVLKNPINIPAPAAK
jgi:type IV pilus assembly protein PilM